MKHISSPVSASTKWDEFFNVFDNHQNLPLRRQPLKIRNDIHVVIFNEIKFRVGNSVFFRNDFIFGFHFLCDMCHNGLSPPRRRLAKSINVRVHAIYAVSTEMACRVRYFVMCAFLRRNMSATLLYCQIYGQAVASPLH